MDVQRIADQIYRYEMAYLAALRENLDPYESIAEAFPHYFLGHHRIEAYLARDGVVVARYRADEDSFTFYPQGIPSAEPEVDGVITIRLGGGQSVTEIAQRLSGWIEFGVPQDGRPYRFDIAGFEVHGVVPATGEPFVGSPPWQWITLTNSFARDHWNPQLGRERAAKSVQTAAAAHLLGLAHTSSGVLQQQEDRTLHQFEEIITSFRALLEEHPDEDSIQEFLEQNPIMLAPDAVTVKSQVRFGAEHVADFVIELPETRYWSIRQV